MAALKHKLPPRTGENVARELNQTSMVSTWKVVPVIKNAVPDSDSNGSN
jgi:hypothetical protein